MDNTCRDGGTGRRARLKIVWDLSHESSSLSPGTKKTEISFLFFCSKKKRAILLDRPFDDLLSASRPMTKLNLLFSIDQLTVVTTTAQIQTIERSFGTFYPPCCKEPTVNSQLNVKLPYQNSHQNVNNQYRKKSCPAPDGAGLAKINHLCILYKHTGHVKIDAG